jgi:opacity protein-like surface antigen
MKRLTALYIFICCSILTFYSTVQANEFGVFLGGYSKDSDIDRIQSLTSLGTWTNGERSFGTYFGLSYAKTFGVSIFETEQTLGISLGADKSAKPNTFVYSSNFHIVLPLDMVRIKPFLGGGLGVIYNFGEKAGWTDIAEFLGSKWSFMFNVGGGTKVKVSDSWWLRLTLRDYILPSLSKAVFSIDPIHPSNTIKSIVKKSTHNISFSAGLGYNW